MKFEHAALSQPNRTIRRTISQHVVSSKLYRDCDALGWGQGDLAAVVVVRRTTVLFKDGNMANVAQRR